MFLVQLLSNPLRNRAFFGVKKLWARGLRRHRRLLGAIVRAVARFPHVSQQTCARQRFARQRQDDNSVRQQISKVREHENFVAPADSCAIVRDVNDCRERRNRKLFLLFKPNNCRELYFVRGNFRCSLARDSNSTEALADSTHHCTRTLFQSRGHFSAPLNNNDWNEKLFRHASRKSITTSD